MCCDDWNLASISKESRSIVKNHFVGPYWDISYCSFCIMESAVLHNVL